MSPILVAGPAVEPVTLADAKAHLRVDGADEDALIASLIVAAREVLEAATGRAFVAQTWRSVLDRWPDGRVIPLPVAPAIGIAAVRVSASAGATLLLDPALYRLDAGAEPPRLVVDAGASEPAVPGGIEIDAIYGFGAEAAHVPAPLRLAVLRLVAGWFEHRGDDRGEGAGLPADVRGLIAPFIRARVA